MYFNFFEYTMGLLEHILLPDLRFVGANFDIVLKPSKTSYKWDVVFKQDSDVKDIEVFVDDECIDTINHNVFYNKWDTLSLEYILHEKLVW